MKELIITNIEIIAWFLAILGGITVSDILFGFYKNVVKLGEDFDWKRIGKSMLKLASLVGGIGLLTISLTIFPEVLKMFSIEIINPEVLESVSVLVIFGLMVSAILTQGAAAIKNMQECIKATTYTPINIIDIPEIEEPIIEEDTIIDISGVE